MTIGAGIFLIALGAILTFALQTSVKGIDLVVVGVILMVLGAAGIVLELALFAPRRRVATGGRTVVESREVY